MKMIFFLLISVCFFCCNKRKETIEFTALPQTDFNSKPFAFPEGTAVDSSKQAHDSCMGFSFAANALLPQPGDRFAIGNIVNKQSLKVLNTLSDLNLTQQEMASQFNVITNPCYEKRVLQMPLKSLLGANFNLQLSSANTDLNKEINDDLSASDNTEMQASSWVYLDMKYALKAILDTIQTAAGLHYKNNLLDTSNMVLATVESITNVSFIINTQKDISKPLQALLKSKPFASKPDSPSSVQLFYIDNKKFEMTFNGFFPIVGQFMRAELK